MVGVGAGGVVACANLTTQSQPRLTRCIRGPMERRPQYCVCRGNGESRRLASETASRYQAAAGCPRFSRQGITVLRQLRAITVMTMRSCRSTRPPAVGFVGTPPTPEIFASASLLLMPATSWVLQGVRFYRYSSFSGSSETLSEQSALSQIPRALLPIGSWPMLSWEENRLWPCKASADPHVSIYDARN